MKLVHLTVAALIAACCTVMPQGTIGQETVTCSKSDKSDKHVGCSPASEKQQGKTCTTGNCSNGSCSSCNGSCCNCSSGNCLHGNVCMTGHAGYGPAAVCRKVKPGEVCPVHGYGPCPKEQLDLGLGLRQALAQTNREQPSLGMQPLVQPRSLFPSRQMAPNGAHGGMYPPVPAAHGGMHPPVPAAYGGMYPPVPAAYGGMYPPPQPRFPMLSSFFASPIYMTTVPMPPMPTYTTRGPRDFLNPDPPSIGY